MSTTKTKKPQRKSLRGRIIGGILSGILLLIAYLCYQSAFWYADTYGQLGFDSILYTLFSNLDGVQSGLVSAWASYSIVPSVLSAAAICILLFPPIRHKLVLHIKEKLHLRLYPVHPVLGVVVCLLISTHLIWQAADAVQLPAYLQALTEQSTIFQEEYKDPDEVTVSFPEEKRNLIYIYLESMETSYLSTELGGGVENNLIPELYQLALDNVNFSHNDSVGGAYPSSGSTWTIAAMVSHSAGIPLKTPSAIDGNSFGQDGGFLSGVTSLTDILHDNGYYQALMVGSDATFGGRYQYFSQHGVDRIFDYFTAIEDGIIPEDYYVWWGMEDLYLFQYAKQELPKLAAMDQPFSFTMLTVDTHHVGGYTCQLCGSNYEESYENAIACSSRQVNDFILWLQQQDFYDNTTVVITGDHCSMDFSYFQRCVTEGFARTIYNCFINAAATPVNTTDRVFTTMDMFPSTLAAMGCTIEGDRLGLGVNLFSTEPTLAEKLGLNVLNAELHKYSSYYAGHFYVAN